MGRGILEKRMAIPRRTTFSHSSSSIKVKVASGPEYAFDIADTPTAKDA